MSRGGLSDERYAEPFRGSRICIVLGPISVIILVSMDIIYWYTNDQCRARLLE